ncbi:MAG: protein prkA [Candidatus Sungbacteria bacterium]|nr:protein prkA [Candidatus Sungbacteria bacterium]
MASTSILDRIEIHLQTHRVEPWEGTFRDYLTLVLQQPALAQHAHTRLYNMIRSAGVHTEDDKERYAFFENDLFGIDAPLAKVVEYFKAAALGSDVGRRILLLYGPPSSGKSQLVILLKRGLEEFSQTDAGALYAIADCPQHEDPLNLIPHAMRREFREETGIHVEGELCPKCAFDLRERHQGDIYAVRVRRMFFSEKERCGIGTFVPSDPKSQDIAELVGSIDLSAIGDYGSESDPRAYRFDGELNVANRGMMEFIEMLKADERFLYVLLTLAQEKNIKTGRFPLIYNMQGLHMAPHALRVAAMFAILSRLEESKMAGLTLLKKLKLYDGEDVEGFRQKDVKLIQEQTEREGMDGISPRFIINRISSSLIKPDTHCINPIDILRALKDGIDSQGQFKKADRERYNQLIAEARKEYDEIARTDVQKAFFVSFEQEALTLVDNYLDNVEAYLDQTKMTDPITGEEVAPDEKLMRSLEQKVQVPEAGKDSFRNEIYRKAGQMARRGENFDYTTHEKLKEAIEKQLFEERRDTIKLTISARNPDAEQLRKLNEVVETLVSREGYCADCANALLKYVSSLLAREK